MKTAVFVLFAIAQPAFFAETYPVSEDAVDVILLPYSKGG
jgi:hypothetical protein